MIRDWWRTLDPDLDVSALSLLVKPADRKCLLKVGDVLLIEPLDPEMREERTFALQISLHKPGLIDCESALEALQKFADAMSGIVTAFAPLLA